MVGVDFTVEGSEEVRARLSAIAERFAAAAGARVELQAASGSGSGSGSGSTRSSSAKQGRASRSPRRSSR